ncbi:DUF4760 domain-containing protein [Chryseobacterium bernardetii]|uniref:DUF4760 domain-containing protein n=1 Tax=Chryseobacterium bernardetii TaxID=1241978 RepID=A0A3G6T6T5_9FLAO|nr:DUF4760 domain-containing protein [Chryseobacterium bernardetii]AZB23579.1 DUF4760 domain-containing protein [Chryseobacterium bernardetii]
MNTLFNKRYHIRLVWLIIICLALTFCAVFFVFRYMAGWEPAPSLDYTTKVTLAILAFLTLIYHIHNLENQIKTQDASNRQSKTKYTHEICSDFRRPLMMEINEDLRRLLIDQKDKLESQNIKEFVKFIDDPDNRKYRQALAISLNYFESISAMVLAGDLDNDIVKRLFCKLFGRYYIRLKHYISYRQEEAPKSWVSFETLAKKWLNDEKL